MDVTSVKRIHQSDWTNKGVRFLRARDIVAASKNEEPSDYLYISIDKYNEYSKVSGKVSQGDLLVTGVGSIGVPMLVTDDEPIYFKDGNIIWFKNEHRIEGNFFYYSFKNNKIQKYIRNVAGIGTVGTYTIDSGKKTPISLPSFEEQTQIGTFFKQLDDTIALHQQELTTLKQTKQGFMQKMFPREGESVPEVRFPEFTRDWQQRKLGDLSEIRRGASPRPIQDPKWFDDESDVGWLRISDVTEQSGLIHDVKQHISEEGQKKTLVLNEPHLILSIAATVGKPVINYIKTGIHDGFIVFINPNFNIEFMFQWLEMFRPKWQKYGQPGSQVNINSELVREQDVFLPSLEEQDKITEFFKQLDGIITLHQRELNALKETKKAFLQKMFI
ncbi:Type I restriction-modification system, specificity subunit S [Bacillus badius]|uniref:Type I restriction-modification system, specificity subunit S n=2 Tax=Bacillus badius TaxID=1455 RepID=A0ABR5AP18_BACBA|nr:Type I restriction-modification system, specificity subunit S [Bacillus badius]